MGKHPAMRAGVVLMALALITSCFVGSTFAKYTTSDSGSDTARVAKFGVNIVVNGDTFATEYKSGQPGYEAATVVKSGTTDKVVAPGTYGRLTGVNITGQPEVAVKITYELTKFELGDNWKDSEGNYYCPLVIHVRKSQALDQTIKTTLDGLSYSSADEFEAAVKQAVTEYSQVCQPGMNLTSQDDKNLTIDWAWPFESKVENNVKDTYLGDQAADGNAATITLELTTTVTQID